MLETLNLALLWYPKKYTAVQTTTMNELWKKSNETSTLRIQTTPILKQWRCYITHSRLRLRARIFAWFSFWLLWLSHQNVYSCILNCNTCIWWIVYLNRNLNKQQAARDVSESLNLVPFNIYQHVRYAIQNSNWHTKSHGWFIISCQFRCMWMNFFPHFARLWQLYQQSKV